MKITSDTPWRETGKVSYTVWEKTVKDAGGPSGLSNHLAWEAAGDLSRLALAQLEQESHYGTDWDDNHVSSRNPMNLKDGVHGGYVQASTWAEGIKEWRERITSPSYPDGKGSYAKTTSVAELINVYAPSEDQTRTTTGAYVDRIIELMNDMPVEEGEESMPELAFGRVKHPEFIERDIPNGVNTAWSSVAKRTVRAVVLHRMLGSLWGTDEYFRNEGKNRALTDHGVGVTARDGAANAGVLLRWNDPRGHEAPWSSGPVSEPYGDGKAFVDRYGVNEVNSDTTAIEISGDYNTPLDDKVRKTIAQFLAYWADQYKIAWDTFPMIPSEGNRSFVCWHQEFTIGTGKVCPGEVVIRETPALIEAAKKIMKAAQTANTTPVEVKPTLPPMPIQSQIRNQKVFLAYEKELVAVKDSKCFYRAEPGSDIVTTRTIKKGDKCKIAYTAIGGDDQLWFLLTDGCRVPASVFVGLVGE